MNAMRPAPFDGNTSLMGDVSAPQVRMTLPLNEAGRLAQHLLDLHGSAVAERLSEQLWLRTVLVEQRRRVPRSERVSYDAQADRLLAALDPLVAYAQEP